MKIFGTRRRGGFTIVEMLMVVAVLGVLITIVTTAASSAMRQARDRKASALKATVRSGILAYKNQKGYYPPKSGALQKWADNGLNGGKHVDYLSDSEYDQMMREIVSVSIKGTAATPVLDPTGLLVIGAGGAGRKNVHGQEFKEAVKKNKAHGSTLTLSSMSFGYPESSQGYFRRFVVKYNADTDDVTVLTQGEYQNATGNTWPAKP